MANHPPCKSCDLAELCMISQSENYRLQALIYPFARAECEPPRTTPGCAPEHPDVLPVSARRARGSDPSSRQADASTAQVDALAEKILDCLAGADRPMTLAQIAEAVDERDAQGRARVKRALAGLERAGEAHPLPDRARKPARGRRPSVWVLG